MSKKNETKLPFHHKLFYLDITSNPSLKTKLESFVKQLGGTVENFLDRKVRYVVTDKPQKDWPIINKDSKQVINTAEKQENKLDLMSLTRGKMLATKTPSSSAKTKDVLDTALKLNMKILTHRSILDFCKKYMKVSIDEISCEQQTGPSNHNNNEQDHNSTTNCSTTKIKIRQLKAPFLKVEDKEEKFAPVYKEFETWPSICIDSNSSSLTNNTNITNNLNQTPTVPKNFNTSKLLQPLHKKRQRIYFCEICSKEFTNMIEHVKTEQHQDYMKNEENYRELKSVIESLPNWTTLNETNAFDENDEFTDDEESDFEDDESSDECSEDDAYSSESNKTNQSVEEMNNKEIVLNSDQMVPASFTTPIKLFNLNNIFNNIKRDECEN